MTNSTLASRTRVHVMRDTPYTKSVDGVDGLRKCPINKAVLVYSQV